MDNFNDFLVIDENIWGGIFRENRSNLRNATHYESGIGYKENQLIILSDYQVVRVKTSLSEDIGITGVYDWDSTFGKLPNGITDDIPIFDTVFSYKIDELVEYDKFIWIALVNSVGSTPTSSNLDWAKKIISNKWAIFDNANSSTSKGISKQEVWSSAKSYDFFDVVYKNNSYFVCKTPNTNQEPPNSTYWEQYSNQDIIVVSKKFDSAGSLQDLVASIMNIDAEFIRIVVVRNEVESDSDWIEVGNINDIWNRVSTKIIDIPNTSNSGTHTFYLLAKQGLFAKQTKGFPSIGGFTVGRPVFLGKTERDGSVSIRDYSKLAEDEFGNIQLEKRKITYNNGMDLMIENEDMPFLRQTLDRLRMRLKVFYIRGVESTATTGYLTEYSIKFTADTYSILSLKTKGRG